MTSSILYPAACLVFKYTGKKAADDGGNFQGIILYCEGLGEEEMEDSFSIRIK